jgi:uncharacterized protein YndB with AHSA1/START domain
MKEFHGTASARVYARPQVVFDLITDVGRLPEWNTAIETVLERPPALSEGAQWTVKMHPPHVPSWVSVSRVEEIDQSRLHFAYETRNADGNPSYAQWIWTVIGVGNSAEVTVSWDVYLRTLDRRILAGPLRKRQLQREVQNSLAAISEGAVTPAA